MEKDGTSTVFLLCKLGITFASIAFIGFTLSMKTTADRLAEREELELIANTITSVIEKIDSLPRETEFYRELAPIAEGFEVSINGELVDGLQIISVRVTSINKLDRLLVLSSIVNNGNFIISLNDPCGIIIRKSDAINLELVG
ncbi:MAG: hypothetical protein ACUVQM_00520 [Candidatus Hadarchaeaceae archaeon]